MNNCDIFAVCETFLSHNSDLELNGYKWVGNNRKIRHEKAKRGSGGVGMFIKMSFLNKFRYCILDDTYDDILWVKFWNADSSFCVCVCYLPPDGSTRTNDAEEFYRILTEQVYQYQNIGNIHICGDFNSRCGEGVRLY